MPEFPTDIDGEGLLLRADTVVLRDVDTRKGLVDVQVIPYGQQAELIPGVFEEFVPGAFGRQVAVPDAWARIKLLFGHDQVQVPLGRAVKLEERGEGLGGTFQMNMRMVNETPRGKEVWLAMEDGDLDEVSVGFHAARRGGTEVRSMPDGSRLLRRVRAHLSHLALVPVGAYGAGARVLAVRHGVSPEPTDPWEDWKARIEALR